MNPTLKVCRPARCLVVLLAVVAFSASGVRSAVAETCRIGAADALQETLYSLTFVDLEVGDRFRVIGLLRTDGKSLWILSGGQDGGWAAVAEGTYPELCIEYPRAQCLDILLKSCEPPEEWQGKYWLACWVDVIASFTQEGPVGECPDGELRIEQIVGVKNLDEANREEPQERSEKE